MEASAGIDMAVDGRRDKGTESGRDDAGGEAEAAGVGPVHFPHFLRGAPDGDEVLGALAQVGFVPGDAHGDDLVVAPAWAAGARGPRHGLDDQLDGLEAAAGRSVVQVAHAHEALAEALDELARAVLAGAQGEACLHAT